MIKEQKISIIMSVYNEPIGMICQSIDSLLSQTYKDFELIIVDDNPENFQIKELLLKYKEDDKRVICIFNEINIGLANSLNKALGMAKYDFIARMDADDIAVECRLEKQLEYMNTYSHVDFIGANTLFIDETNERIERNNKITTNYKNIKRTLPYYNTFCHPTWFFKRKVSDEIGGYRGFPCAQDYDFALRALEQGFILENMNEVLLYYRVRENSISTSKKIQQYRMAMLIRKMYKKGKLNHKDVCEEKIIKLCNKDIKKFEYANEYYINSISALKDKKYHLFIIGYLKAILLSNEQRKLAYNDCMCKINNWLF